MLKLLEWGFHVPSFGIASTVIPKVAEAYQSDNLHFVVHLDMWSSRGESKLLMDADTCLRQHPYAFVTHFLGDVHSSLFSMYKFLKIGPKAYGIKVSGDYWKAAHSSAAEVKICCESITPTYNEKIPYALYSIDYVIFKDREYAVDFDNAPILSGSGIEEKLSARQAATNIKDAIEYFQSRKINYF